MRVPTPERGNKINFFHLPYTIYHLLCYVAKILHRHRPGHNQQRAGVFFDGRRSATRRCVAGSATGGLRHG